jgi:tRNA 2-thiouridine synthesizing protein A
MKTDFSILDVSGQTCPIPVLRLKKILKTTSAGDKVKLIATDPNTKTDVQRFCQNGKSTLMEYSELAGVYSFLILKV